MKKSIFFAVSLFLFQNKNFAQVPNYVPTSNLIAWIPFDNNLNDYSGNGNNATGIGFTYASNKNGMSNKAISFPGNTSYAQLTNLPINTHGNYTVNYWVKVITFTNFPITSVLMDMHPGTNCTTYPNVYMNNDNVVAGECLTPNYNVSYGNKSLFVGKWRMLTEVFQADSTSLYFDGQFLTKYAHTWGASTNANITVGNNDNLSNNFNHGSNAIFDDLGVWSRSLSACEIKRLYYQTNNYISQQPVNVTASLGSNVIFTIASSIPSVATYQWQMSNGSGFINLMNSGQYSGVYTNTLTVSNINNANQNQSFRCLVAADSSTCQDTSTIAKLSISNTEGVVMISTIGNYLEQNTPNPFHGATDINYNIVNLKSQALITVYDIQGKKVFESIINKTGKGVVSINDLQKGVYFYSLIVDGIKIATKKMVVLE